MIKFKSCGNCNNGYIEKNGVMSICKCKKIFMNNLKLYKILMEGGLLTDSSLQTEFDVLNNYTFLEYKGKDSNGNIKKLETFVNRFCEKDKIYHSLHQYWFGKQGTQKTTTAKGILTLLAKQNFSVYYIFTKDLVSLIMDSERDEEKAKQLDFIQNVDCLVLDEFQSDRMALYQSGYKQNIFTPWLKKRLEVIRKSTILLSNDSIEIMKKSPLGELLGDVIDRETRFAQFEFMDNYGQNLNINDFQKQLDEIWG